MKILIADDHVLFREALRQVVLQLDNDISIIEAHDWHSLLEAGKQYPDLTLALIDLNMPGMETFTGLELFFKSATTVPVVVVSASESMADARNRVLSRLAISALSLFFIQFFDQIKVFKA